MARLLRIQDRILLLLADVFDFFDELKDPGGLMSNYFQIVYGWVPYRYRKLNLRKRIDSMLRVGYIEKIVKDGQPYLRITSQGKKRLERDFPLLGLRRKKWKGIGTLVSFDIKEVDRSTRVKFRHLLLNAGAGQLQRSVYLFAYNLEVEVKELVEYLGLEKNVEVLPVFLGSIKDKEKFARRVWKVDDLEEAYEEIIAKFERLKKLEGKERERMVKEIRCDFLDTIVLDPFLPKAFLPEDWAGDRVLKLVRSLS